jgi:deoxyribonuclease-4
MTSEEKANSQTNRKGTRDCTGEWQVGAHMGFSKQIYSTLKEAVAVKMRSVQFFMGSPQSYQRAKIDGNDIGLCKTYLENHQLNVFSHFPYLANLAGSVKTLAWQENREQDGKTKFVIHNLEYELGIIAKITEETGMQSGVVIHPGNYKDRAAGLAAIAKSIDRIKFPPNSKLLLENSAGKGVSLAVDLVELKTILDTVSDSQRPHLGICIDTCHAFDYGLFNPGKIDEVDRFFNDFANIIGMEYFSLLHLNDSCNCWRSKRDVHACLGQGHIWNEDMSSLVHLLDKCGEHNIPVVLETTPSDMQTIEVLNKLR